MIDRPSAIRVVKIGGSLLEWDDLRQRIEDWRGRQSPAITIWIVGGGQAVEEIRQREHRSVLDSDAVHWSCIAKMDSNAKRITSWFPDWKTFDCDNTVDDEPLTQNWTLSHLSWVRRHAEHLPQSWDVTSDSIAATFADAVGASELVLLKSADPPMGTDLDAAVSHGFVDAYFPQALNDGERNGRTGIRYSVRVVNLRSPTEPETIWTR